MRHFRHSTSTPTPLSISILGFLVLAFIIGTVAVVSEPNFDIREQAYVPEPVPTALLAPDYQGLIWQQSLSGDSQSQDESSVNEKFESIDSHSPVIQTNDERSESLQAGNLAYVINPEVTSDEARVVQSAVDSVFDTLTESVSSQGNLTISLGNSAASSAELTNYSVSSPAVVSDLKSTVSIDISQLSYDEQGANIINTVELNAQIAGAVALNKISAEVTSAYCPKVTCKFSQAVTLASIQDGITYDDTGLKTGSAALETHVKVQQTIYTDISEAAGKIVSGGPENIDTNISKVVAQTLKSTLPVEGKVRVF